MKGRKANKTAAVPGCGSKKAARRVRREGKGRMKSK